MPSHLNNKIKKSTGYAFHFNHTNQIDDLFQPCYNQSKLQQSTIIYKQGYVIKEPQTQQIASQRNELFSQGATAYRIVVQMGERLCPRCASMDGRIFPIQDFRIGDTAPPFHPNCRCEIQLLENNQESDFENIIQLGSLAYIKELDDYLEQRTIYDSFSGGYLSPYVAIRKIMDDVNTHPDTSKITEENWNRLLETFNSFMTKNSSVIITDEIHYFRNKLNRAPATFEEFLALNKNLPDDKKWRMMPAGLSIYHMYGDDGGYNTKFVSADGKHEAVYNKNGILLTEENDPSNMGTYNYVDPADEVGHLQYDVFPWYGYGNAKTDPMILPDRLINAKDSMGKLENDLEAIKHRSKMEDLSKKVGVFISE